MTETQDDPISGEISTLIESIERENKEGLRIPSLEETFLSQFENLARNFLTYRNRCISSTRKDIRARYLQEAKNSVEDMILLMGMPKIYSPFEKPTSGEYPNIVFSYDPSNPEIRSDVEYLFDRFIEKTPSLQVSNDSTELREIYFDFSHIYDELTEQYENKKESRNSVLKLTLRTIQTILRTPKELLTRSQSNLY